MARMPCPGQPTLNDGGERTASKAVDDLLEIVK